MLSFFKLKLDLANALNKSVAAALPISNAGWVIVVRDGFKIDAVSRLEKQTIFTSSGIFNFNDTQALYNGVVSFSTEATTPLGLFFCCSKLLMIG